MNGRAQSAMACLLLAFLAAGAPPVAEAQASKPTVILDSVAPWRMYHVLKPPVIQLDQELKRVEVTTLPWLNWDSPPSPADWKKPDFDDRSWLRGPVKLAAKASYVSRVCVRGKFEVTDPGKAGGLSLSVGYRGGVIVYANGQEVARQHLPAGSDLAEAYPAEVFVTKDGKLMGDNWWWRGKYKEQVARRDRTLADVPIPGKMLRKGTNVIALEIVRAPYHKVVEEKKGTTARNKREQKARGTPYALGWNTCQILSAQLKADSAEGLVPGASRPQGLQAWNGDILLMDHDTDFKNPAEPLRPISLVGPRNGRFSGKVLVGSPKAIQRLKATPSDLKGPSTIPASQVQIRYAVSVGDRLDPERSVHPGNAAFLNALLDSPPDEFPAGKSGAVVPIWVTVKVPKDAKPGAYAGKLKIEAKGEKPMSVQVKLEVQEWTLPGTQDYRTWVEVIQSPETIALEYKLPMWSERHWEMIAKSLEMISRSGSRVVYVPLIAHTNFGNAESMVRWIKKGENKYEYDLSIMEKYLDLVKKHMGRPKFVVFNVWEVYLKPPKKEVVIKESDSSYVKMEKSKAKARWELRNRGPAITVVDPATKKTDTMYVPKYENPASKEFWQPLWTELRKRMARRGLEEVMALGMLSDSWPTKEETIALKDLSGGLPWAMHSHGGSRVRPNIYGISKIAYTAYVWNSTYYMDPKKPRLYGWKQPALNVLYLRFDRMTRSPGSTLRHLAEVNITGSQRGVGRIGAEFWPLFKDKRGRRKSRNQLWQRYPQSYWHSLNLTCHMFLPGPEGPVPASRYEIFCEGVQECEARIYIEQALTDEKLKGKLGAELARRAQECLDERLRYMWLGLSTLNLWEREYATRVTSDVVGGGAAGHRWFAGSGWQERTRKLYALASEVEKKLEK